MSRIAIALAKKLPPKGPPNFLKLHISFDRRTLAYFPAFSASPLRPTARRVSGRGSATPWPWGTLAPITTASSGPHTWLLCSPLIPQQGKYFSYSLVRAHPKNPWMGACSYFHGSQGRAWSLERTNRRRWRNGPPGSGFASTAGSTTTARPHSGPWWACEAEVSTVSRSQLLTVKSNDGPIQRLWYGFLANFH